MTSNGKGSQRRGADPASRKRYADGWDRVFKKPRAKAPKLKPYPARCCYACGIKASGGRKLHEYATYHQARCDVCGEVAPVTEPRDFRYPRFAGHAFGP